MPHPLRQLEVSMFKLLAQILAVVILVLFFIPSSAEAG